MATKQRYRPLLTVMELNNLLNSSYQVEVSARCGALQLDKPTKTAINLAANWLINSKKFGLMLYGTVGSGKTTLAKSICRLINTAEYSDNSSLRKSITSVSATEIIDIALKPEGHSRTIDKIKTSEMLFIDDLGTEANIIKSWGNELTPLIDILQYRYENQLFTIVTTNLNDDSIRDVYGERVADRFNEMFDCIAYLQPSYRK